MADYRQEGKNRRSWWPGFKILDGYITRKFLGTRSGRDGELKAEEFVVDKLREVVYPEGDFHRVFVGEIVGCWEK